MTAPAFKGTGQKVGGGQIALALKQNGMKLPDKLAIKGLWYE